MRRSTFAIVIGLSGLLGGFWISACSVNTNGAAPEASDAAPEASIADSTADAPDKDVVEPTVDAPTETSAPGDAGDAGEASAETCTPSNCAGACCGNHCVSRSCQGCATGSLFCPYSTTVPNSNGECVASCSSCSALGPGGGVSCFSCAGSSPIGSCVTTVDQCPSDPNGGACRCLSGDAGGCPGSTQVCVTFGAGEDAATAACLNCGLAGTQGLRCKSGQSCDQAMAACGI
jgi:hypothetical protein